LADGGIWNNLGTQVLREDGFIGAYTAMEDGIPRQVSHLGRMFIPLFAVDGSAPLNPSRSILFSIPGAALVAGALSVARILNTNTVVPRANVMKHGIEQRQDSGRRPTSYWHDSVDLVADLAEIKQTRDLYIKTWGEEQIRETDPHVKDWESEVASRFRFALDYDLDLSEQMSFVQYPPPTGSFPVVGFGDTDDWDKLKRDPSWLRLTERFGVGTLDVPTSLGRLSADTAQRLIARAYINTFMASLYLAPLTDSDLQAMSRFSYRLERITGAAPINW
jgi:hypothetical protein